MRLARLNHKVIIQIQRRSADDQGGSQHLWDTYAERWASVRGFGGGERKVFEAIRADVTYEVLIRFDPNLPADCRVIWRIGKGTTRRILKSISQGVDVEGRGVYTKLSCSDQGEYTEAKE